MVEENNDVGFFIDTNVIIHHIILTKLLQRKEGIQKGTPRYERYKQAYEFIKKIMGLEEYKEGDPFYFHTSFLAQSEFYYALLEEYKCDKMYKGGLPLSSWVSNKWSIKFNDQEIEEIVKDIGDFVERWIYYEDTEQKKILSVQDEHGGDVIMDLIFKHKIRTHDAVLISTAVAWDCAYFVTSDKELRKLKFEEIKIINSGEALTILKKEIKKRKSKSSSTYSKFNKKKKLKTI